MKSNKYGMFGLAIVAGAGVALWAGLPAAFLLFLLVCPLMMFFTMRGMHGGQDSHEGHVGHAGHEGARPDHASRQSDKSAVAPSTLDGSHERIERP